jgi:hypothetical protein
MRGCLGGEKKLYFKAEGACARVGPAWIISLNGMECAACGSSGERKQGKTHCGSGVEEGLREGVGVAVFAK